MKKEGINKGDTRAYSSQHRPSRRRQYHCFSIGLLDFSI